MQFSRFLVHLWQHRDKLEKDFIAHPSFSCISFSPLSLSLSSPCKMSAFWGNFFFLIAYYNTDLYQWERGSTSILENMDLQEKASCLGKTSFTLVHCLILVITFISVRKLGWHVRSESFSEIIFSVSKCFLRSPLECSPVSLCLAYLKRVDCLNSPVISLEVIYVLLVFMLLLTIPARTGASSHEHYINNR